VTERDAATEEYETAFDDGLREKIALGPSCDDLAIAGRIRSLEDRVNIRDQAINLIDFVLFPQTHERTLKANVKVLELKHLRASLIATLHHDEQCKMLNPLRMFEGGKIAVFGQRSAELRAEAAQLLGRWRQSENELAAYQKAQAARQSARMTGGPSRAEIVAGNIARRSAITE
jgi:hypothetical protein